MVNGSYWWIGCIVHTLGHLTGVIIGKCIWESPIHIIITTVCTVRSYVKCSAVECLFFSLSLRLVCPLFYMYFIIFFLLVCFLWCLCYPMFIFSLCLTCYLFSVLCFLYYNLSISLSLVQLSLSLDMNLLSIWGFEITSSMFWTILGWPELQFDINTFLCIRNMMLAGLSHTSVLFN